MKKLQPKFEKEEKILEEDELLGISDLESSIDSADIQVQ